MSKAATNWDARSWDYDIASFERAKAMLSISMFPKSRAHLITRMRELQAKYPQHIKVEEIPNE